MKSALARRPNTPQVEQLSGARDGQSDEGAPARPLHHLAVKRGVWAGERPFGKRRVSYSVCWGLGGAQTKGNAQKSE